MLRIKKIIIGVISMVFLMTGCVTIQDESDESNIYSRECVENMVTSSGFGRGRNDDIYVALNYLYSDDSIIEKHNANYEITSDDIICYTSEGESFLFLGIYKGIAEYSFKVEDSSYRVKLSKSYSGKWTVDECYLEN